MSDDEAGKTTKILDLEYEIEASPEKLWRALADPAFRAKWLPAEALAEADPISTRPGEAIGFRLFEAEPPFLESRVTFVIRPGAEGGAILRILHEAPEIPSAANDDPGWRMQAAA